MQRLDVQGGVVWYAARGTGRPLLFIHGAGTCGTEWERDLVPLADDLRVIVYDRRGYGASSASPGTWAAHRDDAARVLEVLRATPAAVVGCGLGAIVALALALERPELVRTLVLLEPAFVARTTLTAGLVSAVLQAHLVRTLRGARAGAVPWFRHGLALAAGGTAWDELPPDYRETMLDNAGGLFGDLAADGPSCLGRRVLGAIRCPVTIIERPVAPPFLRKSARHLRAALPHARVVTLDGPGHAVAFHASSELLEALRGAVRMGGAARSAGTGEPSTPYA